MKLTILNITRAAFAEMLELFRLLDSIYRAVAPDAYFRQLKAARRSVWTMPGTSFSSVTVNRNWQTALHADSGDFGPAVATVLTQGGITGADLVFLRYFLPVSLCPGGVLVADTHEYHGNTELYGVPGKTHRVSFFAFLHEAILKCGSVAEETERRERWRRSRTRI